MGYRMYNRLAYSPGKEKEFLDELLETLDIRIEVMFELFSREPWDFFMAVFSETDIIQHSFWEYTDPHHPRHSQHKHHMFGDAIFRVYSKLDKMLGVLLQEKDDQTDIIIVSDHGARMFSHWVSINNLLIEMGYLSLKSDLPTLLKKVTYGLGCSPVNLYRLLARAGLSDVRYRMDIGSRQGFLQRFFLSLSNIDWKRTKAYSTMGAGQIFLNVRGREPRGIVQPGGEYQKVRSDLIEDLRSFRDNSEEPIFQQVFAREDFYKGKTYLDHAPDIVLLARAPYSIFPEYSFGTRSVITRSFGISATHSMHGVLILHGPSYQKGQSVTAELVDVTPTLLTAMNTPIPMDVDGRVLSEAFIRRVSPVHAAPSSQQSREKHVFTEEEEEQIKDRLRSLGYL